MSHIQKQKKVLFLIKFSGFVSKLRVAIGFTLIAIIQIRIIKALPVLNKNGSHTIFLYGNMLDIHFSCNYISTKSCMNGPWLLIFHL